MSDRERSSNPHTAVPGLCDQRRHSRLPCARRLILTVLGGLVGFERARVKLARLARCQPSLWPF